MNRDNKVIPPSLPPSLPLSPLPPLPLGLSLSTSLSLLDPFLERERKGI